MHLSKLCYKNIFALLSIVLIVCCLDQLYLIFRYKTVSAETFILTILFTGINIYFGFIRKS